MCKAYVPVLIFALIVIAWILYGLSEEKLPTFNITVNPIACIKSLAACNDKCNIVGMNRPILGTDETCRIDSIYVFRAIITTYKKSIAKCNGASVDKRNMGEYVNKHIQSMDVYHNARDFFAANEQLWWYLSKASEPTMTCFQKEMLGTDNVLLEIRHG